MIRPHCAATVRVDFSNFEDPAYVFKATLHPATRAVAASTSSNIIKLYQQTQRPELTHVGDLRGHEDTITDLGFADATNPHMVHSSSKDGTVRGWDLRAGKEVER
jgi:WD40 repeat protein